MTAWDYGNARVRALRSRLFDRRGYVDLLRARDMPALLGALSATPYGPDVEAALARAPDLHRFDEVLRIHGERVLHALPRYYEGEARTLVQRMLARWDWRNLRTILHSLQRRVPAEDIEPLLVAAGALDRPRLLALARQGSVAASVDLMRAWGLPTRGLLGDDPLVALDRLWVRDLDVDRINVMTALRLRAARREHDIDAEEEFLPGGSIESGLLDALVRADTAAAARALLPGWLRDWSEDEDLAEFSDALELRGQRAAVSGFLVGDPLGPAIPRAFVAAKDIELRNLRAVSRGIEGRRSAVDIERELVLA